MWNQKINCKICAIRYCTCAPTIPWRTMVSNQISVIPDVYSFRFIRYSTYGTGEYYQITVDLHDNNFTGGWHPFTVVGYGLWIDYKQLKAN